MYSTCINVYLIIHTDYSWKLLRSLKFEGIFYHYEIQNLYAHKCLHALVRFYEDSKTISLLKSFVSDQLF